jgi:hypothetical protein
MPVVLWKQQSALALMIPTKNWCGFVVGLVMSEVEVGLTNTESTRSGHMGAPRRLSSNYSIRNASDRDTNLYLKFDAERTQPARDLRARLTNHPRYIVDLGCGSGTSTHPPVQSFPDAEIVGVDNSIQLLAAASPSRTDRMGGLRGGAAEAHRLSRSLRWVPRAAGLRLQDMPRAVRQQ